MADQPEIDPVTGTPTTGHDWDGVQELNTPLPRWWLIILYASIVWAIGYWIVYPAWPLISSHTKGVIGYSSRADVRAAVESAKDAQKELRDAIAANSLEDISKDANLLQFAMAGGQAAFGDNCAGCHGSGAAGAAGYPNLLDDDWIWGGSLEDIYTTIAYGIRSTHDETRTNDMPAFGRDELLEPSQIGQVVDFVLTLPEGLEAAAAKFPEGSTIYAEQCASCHGDDGAGDQELGAPNLTDVIWLYGGEKADIVKMVSSSRAGVMPAWEGRLDPTTIKQLAVYVHALGGGQ